MAAGTRTTCRCPRPHDVLLDRLEERIVGFRIVEGFSRRVEQRHAAFGDQEPHRPLHPVQPLGDEGADRDVFVARRAHQRDVRIVDHEISAAEFLRDAVARAEIHHVQRAARADIGDRLPGEAAEPVLRRREYAADDEVGHFRGGDVDRAGEHAGIGQVLHRAAADAGRMEDEAVVVGLEFGGQRLHARRRHAEHGDAERRLGVELCRGAGGGTGHARDHAGERMGAVQQDLLRDGIEALNVGHRMHHQDVGGADIAADVAGGDGGDHHLGDGERQAAHAGGRQRRAARAAGRDDAADVALARDPALEGDRHRLHRLAAIAGEDGAAAARMGARHLLRADIGARRLSRGGEVDRAGADADLCERSRG